LQLNKKNLLKAPMVVLFISVIFLWLPVFMNYYGLMEADFLTSSPSFENADLELCPLGPKFTLLFMVITSLSLQAAFNPIFEAYLRRKATLLNPEPLHLRC
jgi:hypothetical protein